MSGVNHVRVSPEYAGQRIDNYLLRTLKGVPKSRIYRIVRKGEVRVNRGRIRPDYRLQTGDTIRLPPLCLAEVGRPTRIPDRVTARLAATVVYEDGEVLVLNKPAGIAVHRGSGVTFGVIEVLRAMRPTDEYLELAHRLDQGTSGCLVLAKTPAALRSIHSALKSGAMDKRYLALVRGRWERGSREVTAPLRKRALRSGERMVEVSEEGKDAITRFRPVILFTLASLLEIAIDTGRTHQIRVHTSLVGHPVAGDTKYGDAAFNATMARMGLRRMFLHAHSLDFSLGTRDISVSAPLDDDLKSVLERLEHRG